ncbi:MAG: AMP-binding protein [Lachnospiraceae bacterium]|nr:AMP-binding protein [Lachnospiraceae bacterium]
MKNRSYPLYENAPKISSIAEMLEIKADSMPNDIAFRFRKGREGIVEKTYSEVFSEVKKAASFVEKTYGKNNHIAIIGENSYEWLIAFFATVTTGNVAVPIDKELPKDEVKWLIDKADVKRAFISKTYSDLLEDVEGISVMTLKELQKKAENESEDFSLIVPEQSETASIFFTSGTSGKSKGVVLSHGNITSEINEASAMFDPEGRSTMVVLPFHHTFGLNVATLMAYNYGVSIFLNKSLKRVKEDIMEAKPDVMMLVPLFIEAFYKRINDGIVKSGQEKKVKNAVKLSETMLKLGIDKRRSLFKNIIESFGGNLKYIISGGAPLNEFYVKEFRKYGIEILNGYGTTECSPCVAINRNYFKKDGSVGRGVAGIKTRISDEGEVLFKGPVVMQGYYKDPEKTGEVLIDGWYHTGDIGHIDEDGFIFLTGRSKNLIILSNGENISPEELESDIQVDPGVNEVLVYDKDSKIIAEIYPEEGYMDNTEYFEKLIAKVNEGRPIYKQIASVKLRKEEFIKNTSKKIVRYKNIPQ